MPTKRKPKVHTSALSEEVLAVLGVGCGINHMRQEVLEAMWREHGAAVTAYHERQGWGEPFVGMLAREEGWEDDDGSTAAR